MNIINGPDYNAYVEWMNEVKTIENSLDALEQITENLNKADKFEEETKDSVYEKNAQMVQGLYGLNDAPDKRQIKAVIAEQYDLHQQQLRKIANQDSHMHYYIGNLIAYRNSCQMARNAVRHHKNKEVSKQHFEILIKPIEASFNEVRYTMYQYLSSISQEGAKQPPKVLVGLSVHEQKTQDEKNKENQIDIEYRFQSYAAPLDTLRLNGLDLFSNKPPLLEKSQTLLSNLSKLNGLLDDLESIKRYAEEIDKLINFHKEDTVEQKSSVFKIEEQKILDFLQKFPDDKDHAILSNVSDDKKLEKFQEIIYKKLDKKAIELSNLTGNNLFLFNLVATQLAPISEEKESKILEAQIMAQKYLVLNMAYEERLESYKHRNLGKLFGGYKMSNELKYEFFKLDILYNKDCPQNEKYQEFKNNIEEGASKKYILNELNELHNQLLGIPSQEPIKEQEHTKKKSFITRH